MVPAFFGAHYRATCVTCDFPFESDPKQADRAGELVCPNCGAAVKDASKLKPSQKVVITPSNEINRFDVIAFRIPNTNQAGIKRVVGLQNEKIAIRQGDIFVDDKRVLKDLATQKKMRIMMNDSGYQRKDSTDGWLSKKDSSSKNPWKIYHHPLCYARSESSLTKGQTPESLPIEDYYGFNQYLNRQLTPVRDLFFEFALLGKTGTFEFRFQEGLELTEIEFDFDLRQFEIKQDGQLSNESQFRADPKEHFIEISSFDRAWKVAYNGDQLFSTIVQPNRDHEGDRRLEISHRVTGFETNYIRIWRDVHYLNRHEQSTGSRVFESEDGYIVLGDNVPLSSDSRHWDAPRLSESEIIGLVKKK